MRKPARKTFGRSFLVGLGSTLGVLAALAVVTGGVLILPFQPDGAGHRLGNWSIGLQFGSNGSSAGLVLQLNPMHWRFELANTPEELAIDAPLGWAPGFRLSAGPLRVWLITSPASAGGRIVRDLLSV